MTHEDINMNMEKKVDVVTSKLKFNMQFKKDENIEEHVWKNKF